VKKKKKKKKKKQNQTTNTKLLGRGLTAYGTVVNTTLLLLYRHIRDCVLYVYTPSIEETTVSHGEVVMFWGIALPHPHVLLAG